MQKNPGTSLVRVPSPTRPVATPKQMTDLDTWLPKNIQKGEIYINRSRGYIVAHPEMGVYLYNQDGIRMGIIAHQGVGWSDVGRPTDMLVGQHFLYVTDSYLCRVQQYNLTTLTFVRTWPFSSLEQPKKLTASNDSIALPFTSGNQLVLSVHHK